MAFALCQAHTIGGRVEEGHGVVCFDWLKTYHIVYRLMCQKRLRLSPDVFAIWA